MAPGVLKESPKDLNVYYLTNLISFTMCYHMKGKVANTKSYIRIIIKS